MRKRFLATLASVALVATALVVFATTASGAGAKQVSGLGVPEVLGAGDCTDTAHSGADYMIDLSGDLEGCVYGYVDEFKLLEKPGVYKEAADETFVGCYGGACGTFDLVENFHTKFSVFGFCKHPIVKGSGTGDFAGVTGRLDFRDDLAAGNFPYKGHLKARLGQRDERRGETTATGR